MLLNVHTHIIKPNSIYSPLDLNCIDIGFTFLSLGIHPWQLLKVEVEKELLLLKELIKKYEKNTIAIGECGLDKNISIPIEEQLEVFKYHIKLSEVLKLPLIIHCVKAFDELIKLKKEIKPVQQWIIHDFRKSNQLAETLIGNGFYLSLSPSIFKMKKEKLKVYSFENILFETDDTLFKVDDVIDYFVKVKGLNKPELLQVVRKNIKKTFKI